MLEHRDVVCLGLLLDLEDVDVLGELLDLLPADGVDECGLADAVAADEPVLAALHQLQLRVVQQRLAADDQRQLVDQDVVLEGVRLVVDNGGGRNVALVLVELLDLGIQGVLGALLDFAQLLDGLLVGCGLLALLEFVLLWGRAQ